MKNKVNHGYSMMLNAHGSVEALDTLKKNFELQFEPVFSGVFELKDQSTRQMMEKVTIGFSTEKTKMCKT